MFFDHIFQPCDDPIPEYLARRVDGDHFKGTQIVTANINH